MKQFLYGSADRIEGRLAGGWGVIREFGLEERTRQELAELASVQLRQTMPPFPSADQLRLRTRRFRTKPNLGEAGVFFACMSAEAGADHTGRPGNVISHCAVLPNDPAFRAADWFFCPDWVLPYGAREVSVASLPEQLGPPPGWAGTAHWLREVPERGAAARWVAAAVQERLVQRIPVLLVADSLDDGARWASFVQWMYTAAFNSQFRVCIGEDAQTLAMLPTNQALLIVVTPDVPVPERMWHMVVDTTNPGEPPAGWGEEIPELIMQPGDIALNVFAVRDELCNRARSQLRGEAFPTQLAQTVAWFTRPGAQLFGQEAAISRALAAVGPQASEWPEVQQLRGLNSSQPSPVEMPLGDPYGDDEPDDVYGSLADADEPGEEGRVEQAATSKVDLALQAALRLGARSRTGEPPSVDEWLATLRTPDVSLRSDLWALAELATWLTPEPQQLEPMVSAEDAPFSGAVWAVWRRSEEQFGSRPDLEEQLKGKLWH